MPQEAATAPAADPAAAAAPAAVAASAANHAVSGGIVQEDLGCVGCDYNLRTRPLDGVCPECGRPVRETIAFPRLSRSASRWLTSLVDSVTVLLIAFAADLILLRVGGRNDATAIALAMIPWGLTWFGIWLLTRPEPGRACDGDGARAWALRLLASGPYMLFVLQPRGLPEVVLLLSCTVPAGYLYYDHLRRAAERLPAPSLARQARVVRWAVPLAAAVSLAMFFVSGAVGGGSFTLHAIPRPALPGAADVSLLFDAIVIGGKKSGGPARGAADRRRRDDRGRRRARAVPRRIRPRRPRLAGRRGARDRVRSPER